MSTLWAGEDLWSLRCGLIEHGGAVSRHRYCLGTDDFDPISPDLTTRPIAPKDGTTSRWIRRSEYRCIDKPRAGYHGPVDSTDASRFDGQKIFLTLPTQLANATITQTSRIQHT